MTTIQPGTYQFFKREYLSFGQYDDGTQTILDLYNQWVADGPTIYGDNWVTFTQQLQQELQVTI